jgi:hypothetical protein
MTGLFIGRGLAGVLESARVSLRGTLPTQIGTYTDWSIRIARREALQAFSVVTMAARNGFASANAYKLCVCFV